MSYISKLNEKIMSRLNTSNLVVIVGIGSLFIVLLLSIFWGVRSCSSSEYDFDSSQDAIACYHDFYDELKHTKSIDVRTCIKEVNKWIEVRDTVLSFLTQDSTLTQHSREYMAFDTLNDSVKREFERLLETTKCSLSDVVTIKADTSPFRQDSQLKNAVKSASPFFLSLDSTNIMECKKEDAVLEYRLFLLDWARREIKTEADMKNFIAGEDLHFRAFLAHLYEFENEQISDITRVTEDICVNIFRESRRGNIPPETALTYMSMRTVRRLIQNSKVCLKDIRNKKMKSQLQANAYLWMTIQPFLSIDALGIVVMTQKDMDDFKYIATQLPKTNNFAKSFNIDQQTLNYLLPQQLLKFYIQTL